MSKFDLDQIQVSGSSGIDALFSQNPTLVTPTRGRRRVASLQDLKGFVRVSADTLIHKSQKDLWALKKEGDGHFYIERLFDDSGEPIKG